MRSDFHETYNGPLLVDRFAMTFARPTRRETEEETYITYLHDTVDAAYTLLGILMGSASSKDRAGDTGTATESCGHGTAATESCGHAYTGTATESCGHALGATMFFKKDSCMAVGAEAAEGAARG